MNKKKIEKEIYEAPALNKQQVILEQVIAAGSRIMVGEDNGGVMHIWEQELDVQADYDIVL